MLYIVYCQIIIAGETNKIVLVTFMVTHEDIFAMYAAILMPPALGFLYGFPLGMIVRCERNIVVLQIAQYFFLTRGYDLIICHFFYVNFDLRVQSYNKKSTYANANSTF